MKLPTIAALAAVLAFAAPHAGFAQASGGPHPRHETQAQLRRQARVSEAQARRTALGQVRHGHIRSAELEREGGRLIYSFDIAVPGRSGIEEVNVDAVTGRVVAHEHEGPAAERAEARAEGEKIHHR
jgi:hypothetical protein